MNMVVRIICMGQTYDKEFVEILRKYAKEELKKQQDCKVVS